MDHSPRADAANPVAPVDHDHGGHDHGGHGSHSHDLTGAHRRTLWIVLAVNLGFLGAEVVGGLVFGSLALLADAAHMTSDVAGLVIALIAQSLMSRPPSDRHTYGLLRSEVLAAQANGALLALSGVWVLVEAARRIGSPPEVDGAGVVVVALAGLAANLGSAWLLFGARHHNLNMRGAFLHMAADAAGSVAAVGAGAAAMAGVDLVDPVVSGLVGVLVLWSSVGLLARAGHVLLEGTPVHLDRAAVAAAMEAEPEVIGVHHLHLWHLASETVALSGHVVLDDQPSLHEAQRVGDRLRATLADRFGIDHATLELECHDCEVGGHGTTTPSGAGPVV